MRLVVQRVLNASVEIDNNVYNEIGHGLLVYLAIHESDTMSEVVKYADKLKKLRIFSDENDKMNLSVTDVRGEILLISQFTLYGNTKGNNRPSFIASAKSDHAIPLYEAFIKALKETHICKTGIFGADMKIKSINDGPVTILIDSLND